MSATPPSPALLLDLIWQERRLLRDLAGLATTLRTIPGAPVPRRVLVLPGYGMSDPSTALLRRHLRRWGHQAHGWGIGRNTGNLAQILPRAADTLEHLSEATAAIQPVVLVGWSLGGVIARALARRHPHRVAQVITLGTPLQGLRGTAFARLYTPDMVEASAEHAQQRERHPLPPAIPLTVVYTRHDNVVHWKSSLDTHNPHAQHTEVTCSHSGLVASVDVFTLLAGVLAAPHTPPTPPPLPHAPHAPGR